VLVFILGIAPHLDDVEPSVFIEGHSHGIGNERLGGDLFDPKAGRNLEGFQGAAGSVGGIRGSSVA